LLVICPGENNINLTLFEQLKIKSINYQEAKQHNLFKACNTNEEINDKLAKCLIEGKAQLVEDSNQYHLVLFDEQCEVEGDKCRLQTSDKELLDIENITASYYNIQQQCYSLSKVLERERAKSHSINNNLFIKYKDGITNLQSLSMNLDNKISEYNNKLLNQRSILNSDINCFIDTINANNKDNIQGVENTKLYGAKEEREKLKSIKTSTIIGTHQGKVNGIILLPNGHIASASDDKTIKIWDIYKLACIMVLEGAVNCLAVISHEMFASGSSDRTIKIWNCNKQYELNRTLNCHIESIWSLLLLRNGYLASGCGYGSIKI
jgi:WD40 repeat protein